MYVCYSNLTASIITIFVGPERRVFAAHEDVLTTSPFFASALASQFYGSPVSIASPGTPGSTTSSSSTKRITLADESPEIFSSVLEFLYKGDYYPRLVMNKRKNTYELEKSDDGRNVENTLFHSSALLRGNILKDTLIYCSALRYNLPSLCSLSLKKQGLVSGIQCSTIISSARYAYANTPDTDSKLRAHYLALIIRSRETFKRSGTMQMEMQRGGSPLFFDLFVALANHVDDVSSAQ